MTLAKNILRYFSLKQFIIVLAAVLILVGSGVGIFLNSRKDVVLNVDGKQILATTMKSTVSEVLQQNNVDINEYDYISLSLKTKLESGKKNVIIIKRAVPVFVTADGKQTKLMTYRNTVEEALKNSQIGLSAYDKTKGVKLNDKIAAGMKIKVIRINKKIITKRITLAYSLVSRSNYNLRSGVTRIIQKGRTGISRRTYKLVFANGKVVSRKLIKSVRVRSPISKIVERGTAGYYRTSRGDNFRYKRIIYMRATAYTCSGYIGRTACGFVARVGIVAVDPSVIPLGSKLYIEGQNGSSSYGYATAGDTGVHGNTIDLYMNSYSECINWGARYVKVYVI